MAVAVAHPAKKVAQWAHTNERSNHASKPVQSGVLGLGMDRGGDAGEARKEERKEGRGRVAASAFCNDVAQQTSRPVRSFVGSAPLFFKTRRTTQAKGQTDGVA